MRLAEIEVYREIASDFCRDECELKMLRVPLIYTIIRRNVSALFVTGDNIHHAVLKPHADFKTKFQNKQKLEQNIRQRKTNIDLNELYLLWTTYQDIQQKKCDLELRGKEILDSLKKIDPKEDGSETLINKFKTERVMARDELKTLVKNSYLLEDTFMHKFLELPNDIHDRTPLEADQIIYSRSDQQEVNDAENHLNKVDCLEYHDPFCYYLKNEAAKCDHFLPLNCMDMFRSLGYIPFSNPDFVRSLLVEGAGFRLDEVITIVEEDLENQLNLLHLSGCGSMLSFLGCLTRLIIFKNYMPLKLVSSGRSFSIPDTGSTENGLYSAVQTTNIQLFGITANESESLQQFDEILLQMIEFYKRLNRNFRVSYVTGDKLHRAEKFRAVFEMYSHHRKCFVSTGQLSCYGDYISQRLLISIKNTSDDINIKFAHLIHGNLIDVTKLIAILLEEKGVFRTPTL